MRNRGSPDALYAIEYKQEPEEELGALAVPLMAGSCLAKKMASANINLITKKDSFHQMAKQIQASLLVEVVIYHTNKSATSQDRTMSESRCYASMSMKMSIQIKHIKGRKDTSL